MPRVVEFDFTGMEPAQGGGSSDYVDPGRYPALIEKAEFGKSNAGNPMVTVTLTIGAGDFKGKRLVDRFAQSSSSTFGWQRLMAFLGAVSGGAIDAKKTKIDLEKLNGKAVQIDVRDDTMPASDRYAERIVSKIDAYYPMSTPAAPAANGAAPARAAAPAPAQAPAPAPAPAPEPVAVAADDAADEVDDLFK